MLETMEEIWPIGTSWTKPQGGMFLWGILPVGMDSADLIKKAIEKKVAFVPGGAFHANGGGKNTMRLNFSYSSPDVIREGSTRLGLLLRELVKTNGAKN
jgi:2-aminoadipate transaminase